MKMRIKKILSVFGMITALTMILASCDDTNGEVSTPVISDEATEDGATVTITCETNGADIYYSIDDGTEELYEDPINLTADTTEKTYTIKAVAKKDKYSDSEYATKDVTVAAKKAAEPETVKVTVTFKDGDTKVDSIEITSGETVEAATAPTKTGYNFDGWYNGETAYNEKTVYTENTTYTAKWTVITYKITYDVGTGTNAASNPTTYTIESNDITLAEPTGPDTTPVFVAWHAEKADGDAVSRVAIAKGSTGDKKFVAEYRAKKTYTVTYYNGETSVGTESVTEGEKAKGSAIAQYGYKFDGWYTDKDLTTAAAFDTALTGNLSLYGKWHEVGSPAITITYSASDIKVTASEADADGKITLTASSDYSNYKWVYNDETVGTKNVLEVTQTTAGTYIYELTAEKDNETYSACVYVVIK